MDRKLISRRIGSILDDISRLSNALYAMDTTDIQRYPDNYSKHPESSKLRDCKASAHIPEWRELEEQAQPKPAAAPPPAPKPKESAPKKPAAKRKPKSSGTPTAPKSPPSPPASEAPDGIITTDKDSILS